MKYFRAVLVSLCAGLIGLIGARAQPSNLPPLPPPASSKTNTLHHLDLVGEYKRPWNENYDWWSLGAIAFGKMLNEHNALDAVFSGGVIELKPGGPADRGAHQPIFLELGPAWRYYLKLRSAAWNPYATAGAGLLWTTWEYRQPVKSKDLGFITRDYLEGIDGYIGLGFDWRLGRHLDAFSEVNLGGTAFASQTYSGIHNDLLANSGYIAARGGFRLKF